MTSRLLPIIAFLLGAAGVGWAYEHQLSEMRATVAEARLLNAQARETIETLHATARAALAACEDAMPTSVAEQRAAMLDELRRTFNPPTGRGGE